MTDVQTWNGWTGDGVPRRPLAGHARSDANTDYVTAIGQVLREAEDDPAFAALMLMPPT